MKKIRLVMASIFIFGLAIIAEGKDLKHLSKKQQEIIAISAFTANGNIDSLKKYLNEGLDAGLTVNEIKEILVQMYAYCGFPRSLNGLNTFMTVLKERENKGIKDAVGKESTLSTENINSIELGTKVQTKLSGAPVKGAVYNFAPAIDKYLKGHLFGDIFRSDVIDFQTRELATVGALAGMTGVNPQLQAHFKNSMNAGLTEEQVKEIIIVLENKVGKTEAENAEQVLNKYLEIRKN